MKPGTYRVTLTEANYMGIQRDGGISQSATPYKDVPVTAGSSISASFEYDEARASSTSPMRPARQSGHDLPDRPQDLVLQHQVAVFRITGRPNAVRLYPYSFGYTADRRRLRRSPPSPTEGCRSVDPSEWLAGTSNGVALGNGSHGDAVAASPGGAALGRGPAWDSSP